jgi:hypothetical protein
VAAAVAVAVDVAVDFTRESAAAWLGVADACSGEGVAAVLAVCDDAAPIKPLAAAGTSASKQNNE